MVRVVVKAAQLKRTPVLQCLRRGGACALVNAGIQKKGKKMIDSNYAQDYSAGGQSAIGFEAAVADYEKLWGSYQAAELLVDITESEMKAAKAAMDDAIDEVDTIAVAFNNSSPSQPEFDNLLYQLDVSRDRMIEATDQYEVADERYRMACDQYHSNVRSVEESFDVVRSLRVQLERSVFVGVNAANDAEYDAAGVLETLSDGARYLYDKAA